MGLLTILDSRQHRNRFIWKEIIRFIVSVVRRRSYNAER